MTDLHIIGVVCVMKQIMRVRQKDRHRHGERDGKRPGDARHTCMEWNIKWVEDNDCVFFTGFCLVRLAAEISDW